MKLILSPAFAKAAKKIVGRNADIAEDLRLALSLLAIDEFHPKLKTHKLKGYKEVWSCKAAYDLRVIFRFVNDEAAEKSILLLNVGTHDDVY